ncbi:NmrA domain-containing protein [Mycena venus]|uniref:NmrA domain-containing protein n=1 Tax=Mycena venus TaxID=2733690 RepID=A0A8H7CTW4_9AGAR|nr:NmrA domain-containing protein [Mycena venus]
MPIITIFGATGKQGSAVLNAVLADGTFTPRAVSRKTDSESAKQLKSKGIEVVKGDLYDTESLKAAIRGSEAVFGVTNFWDSSVFPGTPNGIGEQEQGKNLVNAAKEEGVKFFIWSGLPSSKTLSNGKYPTVYHIDHKAAIWDYLKASGVPCAALDTGYFADNLWNFALQKTDTGYIIPVPNYPATATQSFTWTRDIGSAALALLRNYTDPSKGVLGKAFPVVTAIMTFKQVAEKISAAIGKEVKFTAVETSGLAELDEMYAYQADIGMYKDTPVPNPELVALGATFGTIDEAIAAEIVPRYS